MSSAALGSNYDNYMIYIGWFTTSFIIVAASNMSPTQNCFNALGLDAILPGDFPPNRALIQRTITRGAMIQLNEDLQFTIFRFSATGTLTTRTPPPARRGSWPRALGSPPPRSRTGSRTGGSGTGRLRDPGKSYFLFFIVFLRSGWRFVLCNCIDDGNDP